MLREIQGNNMVMNVLSRKCIYFSLLGLAIPCLGLRRLSVRLPPGRASKRETDGVGTELGRRRSLKSDFGSLVWNLNRQNIFRSKRQKFVLIIRMLPDTSGSMCDIDSL